ncbi:MAG TPA: O-methyltransferase [Candidatus Acidoferrales bacterium]|nr:O-methyltransferase [Candidatus Acidoferrales bacterium]
MEPITIPEVEKYLYDLLPARDSVLAEMERLAKEKNIPIVGPAVGRVLYQYAQLIGARRIFEMGSAIGYSTLWLARALPAGGKVYYTDGDPKNAEEAKGYFERAGVRDRIELLVGNALELIQQVEGQFDLIFNDVDKQDYPKVFRLAVPRLRRGGLFITDNVFWSGRVGRPDPDEKTRSIQEFNRLLYSSPEVFVTLLPLRDGLAICHKL